MSAGTGVAHSEYNPSPTEPVHFLQIWIQPNRPGIDPSYEQKHFKPQEKRGRLKLIASPDAREGSVTIHQDAYVYAGLFDGDERAEHPIDAGRRAYVHVITGDITVNGQPLSAGDAAKLEHVSAVTLQDAKAAEVLVFDLP
jgi:redox-sensitive bicupin YhaK (pirin superfamily)